jgi:hypothetical protein
MQGVVRQRWRPRSLQRQPRSNRTHHQSPVVLKLRVETMALRADPPALKEAGKAMMIRQARYHRRPGRALSLCPLGRPVLRLAERGLQQMPCGCARGARRHVPQHAARGDRQRSIPDDQYHHQRRRHARREPRRWGQGTPRLLHRLRPLIRALSAPALVGRSGGSGESKLVREVTEPSTSALIRTLEPWWR